MKQNELWQKARKWLLNKYSITLYVFAVLLLFVGEQSFINQFSRAREMRKVRETIEAVRKETADSERVLRSLEHVDSLERFAREKYHMHEENEVVYVVE